MFRRNCWLRSTCTVSPKRKWFTNVSLCCGISFLAGFIFINDENKKKIHKNVVTIYDGCYKKFIDIFEINRSTIIPKNITEFFATTCNNYCKKFCNIFGINRSTFILHDDKDFTLSATVPFTQEEIKKGLAELEKVSQPLYNKLIKELGKLFNDLGKICVLTFQLFLTFTILVAFIKLTIPEPYLITCYILLASIFIFINQMVISNSSLKQLDGANSRS